MNMTRKFESTDVPISHGRVRSSLLDLLNVRLSTMDINSGLHDMEKRFCDHPLKELVIATGLLVQRSAGLTNSREDLL